MSLQYTPNSKNTNKDTRKLVQYYILPYLVVLQLVSYNTARVRTLFSLTKYTRSSRNLYQRQTTQPKWRRAFCLCMRCCALSCLVSLNIPIPLFQIPVSLLQSNSAVRSSCVVCSDSSRLVVS